MNKGLISLLSLALLSLACLQTAVMAPESVAPSPSATFELVHVAEPTLTKVASTAPAPASKGCAVVIAMEALHMRSSATEKSLVIGYLQNGDVVHVVDQSDGDWWFIERAGKSGYARSVYLEARECD